MGPSFPLTQSNLGYKTNVIKIIYEQFPKKHFFPLKFEQMKNWLQSQMHIMC